jgi:hypothetical protein
MADREPRGSRAADAGDHERRAPARDEPRRRARRDDDSAGRTPSARDRAREIRARQREEFGGFQWGSIFFGWLVAIGLAALLTAILSAAGAAVGLTEVSETEATGSADTIGIVGGVLLLLVVLAAYYCGGYVAGRMARFNGPRQGFGVWLLGLAITIVLAVAGVILGAEYNILEQLNLPRIPVDEGSLTTGGLIALAVIVVGTLLAAVVGGKAGTRFHAKVDRVGLE